MQNCYHEPVCRKSKSLVSKHFCLQPEKLLLSLIFTENGAGSKEASDFPRILTGSGKSLAFFPTWTETHESLKDRMSESSCEKCISRRWYEESCGQWASNTDIPVSSRSSGLQSCPEINGRSVLRLPYQGCQAAAKVSGQVGITF